MRTSQQIQTANNLLIRSLCKLPTERTPIWLMRQAGRYLPEYRTLRGKVPDFMTFCKTPELAAEATLQPLQRFPLDAAIVFSDILTIPDALGYPIKMQAGIGPVIEHPIRTVEDIKRLPQIDVNDHLHYVFDTIQMVIPQLKPGIPLIGFAGSPWTIACYMLEGSSSKTFHQAKKWLYQEPKAMMLLLERLTTLTIDYLIGQIKAGARVIMLFDTWGGLLTPNTYQRFSLYYLSLIAATIKQLIHHHHIPIIFFTKNSGLHLEHIAKSGCDAISLDWTIDIKAARQRVGHLVALQGNLDPAILLSNPQTIRDAVQDILNAYGSGPGHIFNLGHGIDPQTPVENVSVLIEAVHHYSQKEQHLRLQ